MRTYTVKVEYRTPKGSHIKYKGLHSGKTEGEAFLNTLNHLQVKLKRKIGDNLRMTALPMGEQEDGLA